MSAAGPKKSEENMVGLDSDEMRAALRRVRDFSAAAEVAHRRRKAADENYSAAIREHDIASEDYIKARNALWKLLSGVNPDSD